MAIFRRAVILGGLLGLLAVPALADPSTGAVNGAGYPSTSAAVTITTHAVFQQLLAANSARKGCFIQNTSADTEYVFIGATASATTAASVKLISGAAMNCASGIITPYDNVAITSGATDGATAVVISQ
jgi:hypothetical protein